MSGFILGMPFAKSYLMNGSSVNIGNYFFRRLTRLEPPYILVMTVLLFGSVYVSKTVTLSDGLTSYFASIFYSHNFIYGRDILPLLNGVAWSLEIEIQFYILAPLMGYIFLVKSPMMRRLSLVILAIIFLIINHNISLPFRSLIEFFQYFLVGFLLADLYVSKSTILPKTKFDYLIGLIFFLTIWMFDKKDFNSNSQQFIWEFIQLMSIFFYIIMCFLIKYLKSFHLN
ncbi:acyltransferase family protein [Pedobacter steynii]